MYKICIFCDFYKFGATGSIPAGAFFFPPQHDLQFFKSAYLTLFDKISKFQPNILL